MSPASRCQLLLTAFEPYGNFSINASQQVLQHLEIGVLKHLPGAESLLLPCASQQAWQILSSALASQQPSVLICLGQAPGRAEICLERLARNCLDFSIPDNMGQQPQRQVIEPEGPESLASPLPLQAWATALNEQGIATQVSEDAGTYLCNQVYYQSLYYNAYYNTQKNSQQPRLQAVFVHLPLLPEQLPTQEALKEPPALALKSQCQAVQFLISEALKLALSPPGK
ncbi:pyroglutamyl-peptidase I [Leptolyngbya sp. FACHB-261]|uniref:pyroglutamyl-peptidase I n=1 Tax=Leptolyngbya sp. FACHB-261 TaxID=2692806 RepID=UPI0016897165|nr:pyroglutamyl-peptidase I [Leptolyngbya sp. FACHB-261]MBD2104931.1 pyroglutamyl-peptidase I [Leptolyngbya sp. FACHB-261]